MLLGYILLEFLSLNHSVINLLPIFVDLIDKNHCVIIINSEPFMINSSKAFKALAMIHFSH